jgi:protein-tyrosine kinase
VSQSHAAPDGESRVFDGREEELRTILIAQRGLSGQDVGLIDEVMRGAAIGFNEAALRLGLITPEDLRRALGHQPGSAGSDGDAPGRDEPLADGALPQGRRTTLLREQFAGEPVKPSGSLAGLNVRFSSRAERMLALRTELLLTTNPESQQQSCMIAIISAFPGEGRSRLAAELAISFAQLRDSTLLVDADMRRPSLHRLFEGADVTKGLAQAIDGGAQPVVQPVEGLPEMSLLTAGAVPDNPLDLLSDVRFEDLMAIWRSHYRFVVIDTPSVSECADALAIAHAAGRALIVCRADRTAYDGVRAMQRRLATTRAEVIGAVINHF